MRCFVGTPFTTLFFNNVDIFFMFQWSDRLKTKSSEIHNSFRQIRNALSLEPDVRLSDLLSARKDLAILEKTSSASVRRKTQSDVNKVVIGSVSLFNQI